MEPDHNQNCSVTDAGNQWVISGCSEEDTAVIQSIMVNFRAMAEHGEPIPEDIDWPELISQAKGLYQTTGETPQIVNPFETGQSTAAINPFQQQSNDWSNQLVDIPAWAYWAIAILLALAFGMHQRKPKDVVDKVSPTAKRMFDQCLKTGKTWTKQANQLRRNWSKKRQGNSQESAPKN